jgi:integrase
LALAKWTEFEFIAREWHIPAEHDKENQAHIVPLTDWAIEKLMELKMLSNGSQYVPNSKGDAPAHSQLITRSVTRLQKRFQAIEQHCSHQARHSRLVLRRCPRRQCGV